MDELEFNALVQRFIDIAAPYVVPPAMTYNWAVRQAADFQQYKRKDGRSSPTGVYSTFTPPYVVNPAGRSFSGTRALPTGAHPKRRPTKRERMHQARKQE